MPAVACVAAHAPSVARAASSDTSGAATNVPAQRPNAPAGLTGRALVMVSPRTAVEAMRAVSEARIARDLASLASFRTRHTLSDTTSATEGIGAARRWIYRTLQEASRESGGRLRVAYQPFDVDVPQAHRARLVNVVATLPGTDPHTARVYVIGAHYDSRGTAVTDSTGDAPGADDDGSGTALVLELTRVLSRLRLPATVVFAAFAGEEQGLLGSTYYAQSARQAGLHIDGMWANDIVGAVRGQRGAVDSTHVRLFSPDPPTSPSRELARYTARAASGLVPGCGVRLVARPDRIGRGSDHLSFIAEGWPAARFCEPIEDYRHQHQTPRVENGERYGDLLEFVSPRFVAQVARVNAAAVIDLASAPAPVDSAVVTGAVEPDVHLRWWATADVARQGFKVLRRATTASVWQEEFWVGERSEITLPGVVVDDNEFAVVAVGYEAESRAVAARLVR
jgi:hypothetical protein